MNERSRMPFKFGAWHTEKKVWFTAEEMSRHQLTLLPDGSGFINVNSMSGRFSEVYRHLIPVPYTGVEDMNGTEARDNDTVIFEAGVTGMRAGGVVGWRRNGWHIIPVDEGYPEACGQVPLGGCCFWITGSAYEEAEDEPDK